MGRADGLIQPAGFAGNSGKNSGFRQTGRVRRRFSHQKHCKVKWLAKIGVAGGTGGKIAGTADFKRGEPRALPIRREPEEVPPKGGRGDRAGRRQTIAQVAERDRSLRGATVTGPMLAVWLT